LNSHLDNCAFKFSYRNHVSFSIFNFFSSHCAHTNVYFAHGRLGIEFENEKSNKYPRSGKMKSFNYTILQGTSLCTFASGVLYVDDERSKSYHCTSTSTSSEEGKKFFWDHYCKMSFPSDIWSSIGLRTCWLQIAFAAAYSNKPYKLTHAHRKSEHFHDFLIKTHLLVDNCKHPCTHKHFPWYPQVYFANIVNFRMTACAMFIHVTTLQRGRKYSFR
jgi:hypothetical protein